MAAAVYELVVRSRNGHEHRQQYASREPVQVGDLVALRGQRWLVDSVEPEDSGRPLLIVKPARYRLVLRHPDGRLEPGVFRRFRAAEPGLGHAFTTVVDGQPVSWQVVDEQLARDEADEPYLELVAERDYAELDDLPDHELEHQGSADRLPPAAVELLARAAEPGMGSELVALEPGREPDWQEAARFIGSLILEEIGEDLLELCGVHPDSEPRERWLDLVKERLRSDLELFRTDVEGDHDEIEEWDSDGTRILASVGSWEDEANPSKGHGWMVRLVDASALGAAGFQRVRKADL